MPGPVVTVSAQVICLHGGQATPLAPDPRVLASGQPVVTMASPWAIAGCPLPPIVGGPCVTGMFLVAATRVLVDAAPVLVVGGQGVCAPTGVPLVPVASAARAIAS